MKCSDNDCIYEWEAFIHDYTLLLDTWIHAFIYKQTYKV